MCQTFCPLFAKMNCVSFYVYVIVMVYTLKHFQSAFSQRLVSIELLNE